MSVISEPTLFKKLVKPLAKKKSLQVIVRRIFTDVNGTIIDKSLAPAALQVKYPIYLFNEFDRKGGLFFGNKNLPPVKTSLFIDCFIWGTVNAFSLYGFSGVNDIQTQIKFGDIVFRYTDNYQAPNGFCHIVLSMSNNSLGAIMSDLEIFDLFKLPIDVAPVEKVFYETVNAKYYVTASSLDLQKKQWQQPFIYDKVAKLGELEQVNKIVPWNFQTPESFDNGFVTPYFTLTLDQYVGIFTYMLYTTDSMEFEIQVKK